MTRKEYFEIREKIGILDNISKFMNYIQEMLEIYPEFREMTLSDIDEYLDKKETKYEQNIQEQLKVDSYGT